MSNTLAKHLFLSLFTFLCISAFSQSQPPPKGGYRYEFTVRGLQDTIVKLGNYFAGATYLKDSAKVDNKGRFVFSGKASLPGGIYLVIFPDKTYFEFIVNEPGFSIETDLKDPVNSMKIKGSVENTVFYQHLDKIIGIQSEGARLQEAMRNAPPDSDSVQIFRSRLAAIDSSLKAFRADMIAQNPTTLVAKIFRMMDDPVVPEAPRKEDGSMDSTFAYRYYKAHYLDNLDLMDDRLMRTPIMSKKIEYYLKNLVLQLPDSIIKEADYLISKTKPEKEIFRYLVVYILNEYIKSNLMGMDAVYVHMVDKYYATGLASWVDDATLFRMKDQANKSRKILLDRPAPPFRILTDKGTKVNLYSLNKEYVVLFFYDPDCGHCKKETPKLKKAYDQMKANGIDIEVMAISIVPEEQKWRDFIKQEQLDWINGFDPTYESEFRREYDIPSTPKIFVLDKNKKIIAKQIDVEKIEELIQFYKRDQERNAGKPK
jgi:peroxiredoxin